MGGRDREGRYKGEKQRHKKRERIKRKGERGWSSLFQIVKLFVKLYYSYHTI
jgi:hypothetical protein